MTQRPTTPLCFLLLAATAAAIVAIASAQTVDDNKILVSAAWLCEGLECPEGKECTLEQPQCTSEDCSLKPSWDFGGAGDSRRKMNGL
ncbi:hypothetical protein HPB49_014123 [Dermacentor silvarum]|uniref:Uncharacterized protein n=1 Tax=Dermacentor silvarum TaxID=543639 RepID=A0ACB8CXP9_DERSI|nr:hypothetical protein HPB49_014123 [Dermacentor silvarum]